MIKRWAATAFNQVPHSANEIHGDKVAKDFGFKGGLVPGVTVSAYLAHPAVETWGMDFLGRGHLHVRVNSPLYDGEAFEVDVSDETDSSYTASLRRPDGTLSAHAEVHLANPEQLVTPPVMRGDPIADRDTPALEATPDNMAILKKNGCHGVKFHWHNEHEMRTYLQSQADMPQLLKTDAQSLSAGGSGYANMSFVLGCSNWILARIAHMNPWVHLETTSQNFTPIPYDTRLIAEMEVLDFYNKKGHEFVDARINLFDAVSAQCFSSIDLRAIYRLRGM